MQGSERSGIPILAGDPAGDAPASFTRFALPFTWSLIDDVSPGASPVFHPAEIDRLDERRRYFTPETASALFDRACWYDLHGNPETLADRVSGEFVLHIGQRAVTISVSPPRVVLFEAKSPKAAAEIARTGFLLVDVSFPPSETPQNAPTLDDLLIVNELFRYWRTPYPGHAGDERTNVDGERYCAASLMRELEGEVPCFTRWDRLLAFPVETEYGVRRLVARDAHNHAREWVNQVRDNRGWIAYTDERAFVWTCALTSNGARDLSGMQDGGDPKFSGDWVRLLNVDLPSAADATEFERQWITGLTYERWKHFGTLYGFNMHSGAMLAEPCTNPPVWRHYGELYFDQILLLLYVRVSLFRFSEALAEISKDIAVPAKKDFLEFRDLRRAFVFLTNLYRFPLLSSQQQGIEMYAHARKALDIDDLFREVQTEIETTHEMFELISTSKMADVTGCLTYFVLGAGVLATLMAFLAADDLESKTARPFLRLLDDILPWLMPTWWLIVFAVPVIVLLCIPAFRRQRR